MIDHFLFRCALLNKWKHGMRNLTSIPIFSSLRMDTIPMVLLCSFLFLLAVWREIEYELVHCAMVRHKNFSIPILLLRFQKTRCDAFRLWSLTPRMAAIRLSLIVASTSHPREKREGFHLWSFCIDERWRSMRRKQKPKALVLSHSQLEPKRPKGSSRRLLDGHILRASVFWGTEAPFGIREENHQRCDCWMTIQECHTNPIHKESEPE